MISKLTSWFMALSKVLLALVVLFVAQIVCAIFLSRAGYHYKQYEGLFSFVYAATTSAFLLFLLRPTGRFTKGQRVSKDNLNGLEPFWLFVISMGMLGVVTIYFIIVEYIATHSKTVDDAMNQYNESMDRFSEVDKVIVPNWDHILYFIALVLLVPLAEELIFRGAILESFKKVTNKPAAVILSSVVFGLCHGLSVHILYALFCGIVLGSVYCICDSIKASYIVHAVFNLFGSALILFLESGVFDVSEDAVLSIGGSLAMMKFAAIIPAVVAFKFLIDGRKAKALAPATSVEEEGDIDE